MGKAALFALIVLCISSWALADYKSDCSSNVEKAFVSKAKEMQAGCNVKGDVVVVEGMQPSNDGVLLKQGIFYCASTPFFIQVAFNSNTCVVVGDATGIGAHVIP